MLAPDRVIRSLLCGFGGYLPEIVVTNDELAKTVDTSDEWIRERSGIRQRHIAQPHESCAFMATAAARAALADAGVAAAEVDVIIVATATPDQAFPATALRVQAELGAGGFGFDLAAACTGFVYALSVADSMIRAGQVRTRAGDRRRGLFAHPQLAGPQHLRAVRRRCRGGGAAPGRGAGHGADRGVLSTHLHGDGRLGDILYVDGAVGRPDKSGHLVMQGREVFRHAVGHMSDVVREALDAHGFTDRDIDWLVPHQANIRIIEGIGRKLGLPMERVVVTVDRHANTSAASIPLALAAAYADGRIKPGQLLLLEALGGGLTWGSALVRV